MGLIDSLVSQLTGANAGGTMAGAPRDLVHGVLDMINQQPGGLPGLVERFNSKRRKRSRT